MTGSRAKGGRGKGGGPPSRQGLTTKVKTARGRKLSSKRWLERQLNDPYVEAARREGYRSRAAYKLIQLDDRFDLLRRARRVVDLGAAPGGWTQVAAARSRGAVVAVDVQPMEPIAGATLVLGDMREPDTADRVVEALDGPADLVLSDMAAPATGHATTDHLRIVALCETAYDFASAVLAPGGGFVAKVYQGGAEGDLLARLKRDFASVRHAKPGASRSESAEQYVVAIGFRKPKDDESREDPAAT